jgi:hypothetical protein
MSPSFPDAGPGSAGRRFAETGEIDHVKDKIFAEIPIPRHFSKCALRFLRRHASTLRDRMYSFRKP